MRHHFVAYVFQLSGGGVLESRPLRQPQLKQQQQQPYQNEVHEQQQGGAMGCRHAVVLASLASPSFLLISFRRSGSAIVAENAAGTSSAADGPRNNAETAVHSEVATNSNARRQGLFSPRHDGGSNQNTIHEQHDERHFRSFEASRSHGLRAFSPNKVCTSVGQDARHPAASHQVHADDTFWQHQIDPAFSERGQHLLVLWRFLQHVTLLDLHVGERLAGMGLDSIWSQVEKVVDAPGNQIEGVVHAFLRDLFGRPAQTDPMRVSTTDRMGEQSLSARDSSVILVLVHCFFRVVLSRSLHRAFWSTWTVENGVATKEQLQQRFVRMVSNVYDAFDDELREVARDSGVTLSDSHGKCLPMLVDIVLSIVYGQIRFNTRFNALRATVSTLLVGSATLGTLSNELTRVFRVFAAQAREVMIRSTGTCHGSFEQPRAIADGGPKNDVLAVWNRRWLMKPSSVQVVPTRSGRMADAQRELLVVDVAQFVCEFGCVDVSLGEDARTLSLRSALSSAGSRWVKSMDIVLDGRLRVFRVLPSGLSSMIPTAGGWSVGDYAAELLGDANSLCVDVFAFAEESSAARDDAAVPTRRMSLSLRLEQESTDRDVASSARFNGIVMVVQGAVSHATYVPRRGAGSERADALKLSEMPTSHRAGIWGGMDWKPACEMQARYESVEQAKQ
ncbi:unnamed protein product [Phytophthora fragariaefolia]|uniref:Unnamed protein product n=1 Tax=Phytophthora fragariaefolia TaxID=1490495 RepID=A0A9W7D939_9STRA|nr:unnamed protein product [Phytophthora fragariaefolia]